MDHQEKADQTNENNANLSSSSFPKKVKPPSRNLAVVIGTLLFILLVLFLFQNYQTIQPVSPTPALNLKPTSTPMPTPTPIVVYKDGPPLFSYDNWSTHQTLSPLSIKFKKPTNWNLTIDKSNDQEDWGLSIKSPENILIMLCAGCNLVSPECGGMTLDGCDLVSQYVIAEPISFSVYSLKDKSETGVGLMAGYIDTTAGEEILIRVKTPDNRFLTEQELSTLWKMFLSVN